MPDEIEVPNNPAPETLENQDPAVPVWHSVIYDANQRANREAQEAARLRQELDQLRNAPPPTPPEPKLEEGVVFNDPERFRRVINDDINRAVAPINEHYKEAARQNAYTQLKNRLKNQYPQQASAIAQLESLIDEAFYANKNLQPDEATFMMLLQNIVGRLALSGQLPINAPAPTNGNPNPTPRTPVIPPSSRPSAPPPPPTNAPRFDESRFDENARRLAREWKMSLEEYAIMQDTPPEKAESVWKDLLAKRKAQRGA